MADPYSRSIQDFSSGAFPEVKGREGVCIIPFELRPAWRLPGYRLRSSHCRGKAARQATGAPTPQPPRPVQLTRSAEMLGFCSRSLLSQGPHLLHTTGSFLESGMHLSLRVPEAGSQWWPHPASPSFGWWTQILRKAFQAYSCSPGHRPLLL